MANGFFLCILSPVWRVKLCGNIGGESRCKVLDLCGENITAFSNLLLLGSGSRVILKQGLEELLGLGRMADKSDKYQVQAVQFAVEEAVLSSHLTLETCGVSWRRVVWMRWSRQFRWGFKNNWIFGA